MFTGVPDDPVRLVAPYAENASDFPVFDCQFWYSSSDGVSGPDDLGIVMPHQRASTSPRFSVRDALVRTILTFREAEGVRWVRLPDGTFSEQTHDTARDSVLAALGMPVPPPPDQP